MASSNRFELVNGNITSAQNSKTKGLQNGDIDFVAVLIISNWVSGTFTCTIEHSADGNNWDTVASFAALGANGYEYIDESAFATPNMGVLPNIRATIAGAGLDADVQIALYHDRRK